MNTSSPFQRLGLISAMPQEQAGLIAQITSLQTETRARRDYVSGQLWGTECVCVLSRMGKVAAATTATTLIERFGVTHILFTGVAGALDATVRVGDIVVADHLIQHDMDCSPLFPRFEIPLTGLSRFHADARMNRDLKQSIQDFFRQDLDRVIDAQDREGFGMKQPQMHSGLIASGDEFIACSGRRTTLKKDLPELLAVEMEGAAVAQVAQEFDIPFAIMRTISDGANEEAPVDFMQFIERIAAGYAFHVVRHWCIKQANESLSGNSAFSGR